MIEYLLNKVDCDCISCRFTRFVCKHVFAIEPVPFLIDLKYSLALSEYEYLRTEQELNAGLSDPVEVLPMDDPVLVAWCRQALFRIHSNEMTKIEFCLSHFLGRPVSNCLDVGCGTGEVIAFMKYAGLIAGMAIGTDPSKLALLEARKVSESAGISVEWIPGQSELLPAEPCSQDLVLSLNALPVSTDILRSLNEVARVLTNDGIYYCSFPTPRVSLDYQMWASAFGSAGMSASFQEGDDENHLTIIGRKRAA